MPTCQSEIPMQNARQGDMRHGYVLALGLALAVCAMIFVPFVAH